MGSGKALLIAMLVVFCFSAHAIQKKRNPANILVTVEGTLAGVEARKVKIKTESGRYVYVPRQRVDLGGRYVGTSKVSARMTMAELSSLNPFYHPHLPLEP